MAERFSPQFPPSTILKRPRFWSTLTLLISLTAIMCQQVTYGILRLIIHQFYFIAKPHKFLQHITSKDGS